MAIDRSVFIVVPAYNEAGVIRRVAEQLCRLGGTVVVVDDGSTDATARELGGLDLVLLRHAVNLGQGAALQTGIAFALEQGAPWIVTFDADGQHRVSDVEGMVELLRRGDADAVLGSRFLGEAVNMPWSRRAILRSAVCLKRVLCRSSLTDAHNGLRAFSRKAAAALEITQNGMAHASEIVSQLQSRGMDLCEYPVTIEYTEYSMAKGQSIFNSLNIAFELLFSRTRK